MPRRSAGTALGSKPAPRSRRRSTWCSSASRIRRLRRRLRTSRRSASPARCKHDGPHVVVERSHRAASRRVPWFPRSRRRRRRVPPSTFRRWWRRRRKPTAQLAPGPRDVAIASGRGWRWIDATSGAPSRGSARPSRRAVGAMRAVRSASRSIASCHTHGPTISGTHRRRHRGRGTSMTRRGRVGR